MGSPSSTQSDFLGRIYNLAMDLDGRLQDSLQVLVVVVVVFGRMEIVVTGSNLEALTLVGWLMGNF